MDRKHNELHSNQAAINASFSTQLENVTETQAKMQRTQEVQTAGFVVFRDTVMNKFAELEAELEAKKQEEYSQGLKKKNEEFPGVVASNAKTESRKANMKNDEHERRLLNPPKMCTHESVTESKGGCAFAIDKKEGIQDVRKFGFNPENMKGLFPL